MSSGGRYRVPRKIRRAVFARDGWRCQLCGMRPTHVDPLSIDHIVPVSMGGSRDDPRNLRAAHRTGNSNRLHVIDFETVMTDGGLIPLVLAAHRLAA